MAERSCDAIAAGSSAAMPHDNNSVDLPSRGGGNGCEDSDETNIMPTRRSTKDKSDQKFKDQVPVQPQRNQGSCSSSSQLLPLPEVKHGAVTLVDKEDPASRFRIKRELKNGSGDKFEAIQFPSWLSTNADILTEVLGWLPPDQMIRAASVSRLFKEIIMSDGFRSHVRSRAKQTRCLLGLFPKCSTDKSQRYPFIPCSPPGSFRRASFSVQISWKPMDYWKYVEIMDSRDGKLLLLAGHTSRSSRFVLYYPQSRNNLYSQIPGLPLLDDPNNRLVTASVIPDEKSHRFTIIVLIRRGEADSKMKPNGPATEASVICFTSLTGMWGNPVTALFQMPSKKMMRLGSLLLENMLYLLHPCEQVITINITNLELGMIKLPKVKNIGSRTSHVLTRGITSSQLYLAVVSGRYIAMYSHDGNDWNQKIISIAPGYAKNVALKLVGSTDVTGLIFVKADGRVIYKMEVESGSFHAIADDIPEDEVLPYEVESGSFHLSCATISLGMCYFIHCMLLAKVSHRSQFWPMTL